MLSLGREVAIGLGQRIALVRTIATIAVLLLAGGAVAVAGPVGFVGLMVPHLCRLVVGGDYRRLVPLSTIVGAALTESADVLARTAFGAGQEIPLGVVTAVIGAPCFVWLVRGRGRSRLDGGVPVAAAARTHHRPERVLPVLAGLLVLAVVVAIHVGYIWVPPQKILQSLFGNGDANTDLILWSFRLPRVLFAVLVGGGIAISGAILQGVLRNDLAEPGILGISAGASLAIVISVGFLGYAVLQSTFFLPVMAVCGALAAVLLVCRSLRRFASLLAAAPAYRRRSEFSPQRSLAPGVNANQRAGPGVRCRLLRGQLKHGGLEFRRRPVHLARDSRTTRLELRADAQRAPPWRRGRHRPRSPRI